MNLYNKEKETMHIPLSSKKNKMVRILSKLLRVLSKRDRTK